jgi:probable rRNA maturation factor
MSLHIDIQIADELADSVEEPPPRAQLQRWAEAAWQGDAHSDVEVALRIVSAEESRQLNRDYRGKDKPTNVLSFPMQMDELNLPADLTPYDLVPTELADTVHSDEFPAPDAHWIMLGDLAICAEVVAEEAQQQHKSLQAHWAHMLVHGMLHLQGYDHIEEDEAQRMEQLEIQIMQQLGFSDPYQADAELTNTSVTDLNS